MTGRHAYLWALGVDPDQQRQGLGSSLLAWVAARADESGSPIYLETQSARTVEFYRRAGFEVLAEESVLDGRLHVWGMSRQPRGA
jgi:ribosomal protein S18 acetylase RimI-like enzyme